MRKKKFTSEQISEIKYYVNVGRKNKIKELIDYCMGVNEGITFFKKYSDILQERVQEPFRGSIFWKDSNGLKLFQYPKNFISDHEKQQAKTLLIVG